MKIIKRLFPVLLILGFLLTPFTSAFAISGGLLHYAPIKIGSAVNSGTSTTANVTDNTTSTTYPISADGTINDTLWYMFSNNVTIDRYYIDKVGTTKVEFILYDANLQQIGFIPITTQTGINNITPVSNVKYVALHNADGNVNSVREWDVYSIAIDTIPPANVSSLTASDITDTEFKVSWVKPSDSDYDKAEIYLNNVLEGTVGSTGTQSYSFSALTGDTSYSVKVVSVDKTGNKSNGSIITVKTNIPPDTTAPSNVTNLTATPTYKSVSLSWNNPPETDFAQVKIYEDGVYKKSVTAEEGTNAFFDNLNPETEYTFKVTSVDTTGNESPGTTITVTTLPLPELKDIKNVDKDAMYDRVRLSWELPENEYFHHVNIYRKVIEEEESFLQDLFSLGSITVSAAENADGYTPMFETNGTYWTDLTVEPDTGYEYKLTSENTDGRESTGITVQVETPQEPKPEITGAEFTQSANGDYIVSWQEPTTGSIKLFVGEEEYKTVQANLGTYTIPKSDLKLTNLGDPDVKIQPITDRGTEGDFVANPKMNLPFSVKDVVETGNGLLWLVGPFILLALAFLLVPKFRNLILAAFRGKGKLIDTGERKSATDDKELNLEPKGETVRLPKEPRELKTPRVRTDRVEREVRTGREPRQSIRESREPRVSRRGR
jgi:hypothetical protein